MPIYEYQCPACQHLFEEWQTGFDEKEMECPECGAASKRLISHSSFHLKGSGWYADGYGTKNSGSTPGEAAKPATSDAGDKASAGSEGKTAAPAASTGSSDTSSAGSAS